MSRELKAFIAVLAISVGITTVVLRSFGYNDPSRSLTDFAIDYAAARAFLEGENPFVADTDNIVNRQLHASGPVELRAGGNLPYWHPPFRLITVLPLALMPYEVAGIIWLLFSAATVVLSVFILGTELGCGRGRSAVLGVGILAFPAVQSDLSWGQVNGPILLLLVLAWSFLRSDRDVPAGIALGVAAALKVFPAFLGLSLLASRKNRALWAAVAAGGIVTLASAAGVGLGRVAKLFGLVGAYGVYRGDRFNISAGGQLQHFLGNGLGFVAMVVVGVLLLWLVLSRKADLTGEPFWVAVLSMLLIWPVSWDHYITLAIPWFGIAILRSRGLKRAGVLIALLLSAAGVQSVGGRPGNYLATLGLAVAVALESGVVNQRWTQRISRLRPTTS